MRIADHTCAATSFGGVSGFHRRLQFRRKLKSPKGLGRHECIRKQ